MSGVTSRLPWWRKAAKQALAEAQHGLGHMYDRGKGVPMETIPKL